MTIKAKQGILGFHESSTETKKKYLKTLEELEEEYFSLKSLYEKKNKRRLTETTVSESDEFENKKVFKFRIITPFSKRWIEGVGESLEEAMTIAIERLRERFPDQKKDGKFDKFVRYCRNNLRPQKFFIQN